MSKKQAVSWWKHTYVSKNSENVTKSIVKLQKIWKTPQSLRIAVELFGPFSKLYWHLFPSANYKTTSPILAEFSQAPADICSLKGQFTSAKNLVFTENYYRNLPSFGPLWPVPPGFESLRFAQVCVCVYVSLVFGAVWRSSETATPAAAPNRKNKQRFGCLTVCQKTDPICHISKPSCARKFGKPERIQNFQTCAVFHFPKLVSSVQDRSDWEMRGQKNWRIWFQISDHTDFFYFHCLALSKPFDRFVGQICGEGAAYGQIPSQCCPLRSHVHAKYTVMWLRLEILFKPQMDEKMENNCNEWHANGPKWSEWLHIGHSDHCGPFMTIFGWNKIS